MSTQASIPDGYEFFAGHDSTVATEAIRVAVSRGFQPESVLTVSDGFFVPLGDDEPRSDLTPPEKPKPASRPRKKTTKASTVRAASESNGD